MKLPPQRQLAFTAINLLATVAMVALLSTVLLLAQAERPANESQRLTCANQLKQVGLAFRIWSNDNNDRFPMMVKQQDGGSLEAVAAGQSYKHFQTLSNELTRPRLLVCPADKREKTAKFEDLRNGNLSYFVGIDADEAKLTRFLSGDRNITNGLPSKNTVLELPPKQPVGWTAEIHGTAGNLGLSDGSVHFVPNADQLRQRLQATRDEHNRIQLPETGSGSEE